MSENNDEKLKDNEIELKYSNLIYKLSLFTINGALTELEILDSLCNYPKLENLKYKYKTLEEKYDKKPMPNNMLYKIQEPEHIQQKNNEAAKLQKLSNLSINILQDTLKEMCEGKNIEKIKSVSSDILKEEEEEDNLLKSAGEMIEKIDELQKQIEMHKLEGFLTIKEKDEYIGKMKDQHENMMTEFGIKEEYLQKWEAAKLKQLEMSLENKEFEQKDKLRDYKNKNARELRVHMEIEAYTNCVIEEYYNDIEHWSKKYDTDLADVNRRLAALKNSRIKQRLKFSALSALYKARQNEMNEYALLKEKRKFEQEVKARLNAEATKIQAWWRGQMVRHKLGPYKVKKGKGKGKNKSGEKSAKKNKKQ